MASLWPLRCERTLTEGKTSSIRERPELIHLTTENEERIYGNQSSPHQGR